MHQRFTNTETAGSLIVLQYNWEESLRKNETPWIYHKELAKPSTHSFIDNQNYQIVSKKERRLTVLHGKSDRKVKFIAPFQILENVHDKSIIKLDVAEGGLAVSVSMDNKLNIWTANNGEVRRNLEGHLFDVYACALFPSGVVVLSGGADMLIKIWDAATAQCPVTLQGHTGAVMDMAIVEKGKNIISVSKDGTVRLWNCAEAKCIDTLLKVESEITCCDIVDVKNRIPMYTDNRLIDELEFGTIGKMLAVGTLAGKVYLISVTARKILAVFRVGADTPVLSMKWTQQLQLLIGLDDGRVVSLDASKPFLPQQEETIGFVCDILCDDSASAVLSICYVNDGVVFGRRDGTCQFYLPNGSNLASFTGSNCDPIYSIAKDQRFIYMACRDSKVRKYLIDDIRS